MEEPWVTFFEQETKQPYYKKLQDFINKERQHYEVIPAGDKVLEAFEKTHKNINVVIVGQDPTPSLDRASGLAFSLPPGVRVNGYDYSLNIIFRAIKAYDDSFQIPTYGCLEPWARQGVLLLNSVLTYRNEDGENAHFDKGWETFTKHVLKLLNDKYSHLVFILWGKKAQECGEVIDDTLHYVLKGEHPAASRHEDSPYTPGMFIDKKFFSKVTFLEAFVTCKGFGLQLATILSTEENENISDILEERGLLLESYWLGGVTLNSSGVFEPDWIWLNSGLSISYTNWSTSEPKNDGLSIQCVRFHNGGWASYSCESQIFKFICEILLS